MDLGLLCRPFYLMAVPDSKAPQHNHRAQTQNDHGFKNRCRTVMHCLSWDVADLRKAWRGLSHLPAAPVHAGGIPTLVEIHLRTELTPGPTVREPAVQQQDLMFCYSFCHLFALHGRRHSLCRPPSVQWQAVLLWCQPCPDLFCKNRLGPSSMMAA